MDKRGRLKVQHKKFLQLKMSLRFINVPCSEYYNDSVEFLVSRQSHSDLGTSGWDLQAEVNGELREILVDWLVRAHGSLLLSPASLFLTVRILDMFADCATIKRNQILLVGLSALFIASKYEDNASLKADNLAALTKYSFNETQIILMEKTILEKIFQSISLPTPWTFLVIHFQHFPCQDTSKTTAFYLAEQSLLLHQFNKYTVYTIFKAIIHIVSFSSEDSKERIVSNSESREVMECVELFFSLDSLRCKTQSVLTAVKEKYQCLGTL